MITSLWWVSGFGLSPLKRAIADLSATQDTIYTFEKCQSIGRMPESMKTALIISMKQKRFDGEKAFVLSKGELMKISQENPLNFELELSLQE